MMNWLDKIALDFIRERRDKNKKKLKVSKHDDRMMEDGTLNTDHWTLRNDRGMSDREYNEHLRASDGGM